MWLSGAIFQQDNARPHTAGVSQDFFRAFTTLPWHDRHSDVSLIEHISDHLGRRVGHPMSLNELDASLQTRKTPPSHDCYQQNGSGAALELKVDMKHQTAITRLSEVTPVD
ncbi:transposable element Tcb2 transposase [Trichonephila clavipes]|nr:transposable element Tcb2 transposase [Trichonephila clavipes]